MYVAYLAITLLAAALTGSAAVANLIGHEYPKSQADKVGVPHSWMLPLGALLGAGSAGLLAGIALPPVGVVAASGLVLYFVGALVAHVRVHDRHVGPWLMYFATCTGALTTALTCR